MAQLNNEGYGNQQYITFGKSYKGKTFYDVANSGDFKYLKWCINETKRNMNKANTFKLSASALRHCGSALLLEQTPGEWRFVNNNNHCEYTTDQGLRSPMMIYEECNG